MGSNREKGNRRERQAAQLYQRAGYWVYSPPNQQFTDTDLWGLFDLACFRVTDDTLRFVQVKSNTASGVREWMHRAAHFEGLTAVSVDFLTATDGGGWRVMRPTDDDHAYTHVVDERDMSCNMGEGVVRWLRDA